MSGMTSFAQQHEKPADYKGKKFIGRVVANDDTDAGGRFQRIKVIVPDLLDDDVENLPWAIPAVIHGGSGAEETRQNIPLIGSLVYIMFQEGDTHFPMYEGACIDNNTDLKVLAENYPNRVGWHRKGHHWFIDYSNNDFEYMHPSGFTMHIDADGNLKTDSPGRWDANFSNIHFTAADVTFDANFIVNGDTEHNGATVHNGESTNNGDTTHNGNVMTTGNQTINGALSAAGGTVTGSSGAFNVTGNINATGSILNGGANSNHHSHP
jgi:hypothetical protein